MATTGLMNSGAVLVKHIRARGGGGGAVAYSIGIYVVFVSAELTSKLTLSLVQVIVL